MINISHAWCYRKLMLLRLVVVNVDVRVQRNKLLWNKLNWLWQRQRGVHSILVPYVPQLSNAYAPSHPSDVKENTIYQTSTPSSIALWSRPGVHMTISGAISSLQGSEWAPRLVWSYKSSHKINCNDCVFWHIPIRTSIYFYTHLSSLNVRSDEPLLPKHIGHLWPCCQFPSFPSFTTFDEYCRPEKPHRSCSFLNAQI